MRVFALLLLQRDRRTTETRQRVHGRAQVIASSGEQQTANAHLFRQGVSPARSAAMALGASGKVRPPVQHGAVPSGCRLPLVRRAQLLTDF